MANGALKYMHTAALGLLAVFAPIQGMLLTVLVLVLVDLAFGITTALKAKQAITSRGIRRTITKLAVYWAVLMMLFLSETYLHLPAPVMKVTCGIIAVAELKSLLEHADKLTGGSLFKAIVDRLAPPKKEG